MVYSVIYYATEFIVRAVITIYYAIKDFLERITHVEEKKREEKKIPEGYVGWIKKYDEAGNPILEWHGSLKVRIPQDYIGLRVPAIDLSAEKPTRYYTTFNEMASKGWYKELDVLSKLIKGMKGGEEGR